jgi:hypothetical protein
MGDEYEELGLMADLCIAGQRWQRALVCVKDAQALAAKVGKAEDVKALEAKEASVRAKLGG